MRSLALYSIDLLNRSVILPKFLLLLTFLYLYLYNPILQVLGFGVIKLLLLIAVAYLFLFNKFPFIITKFRNELLFTYFLIAYTFIATTFGDGSATDTPYMHAIWFLECFLIPCFIMYAFRDIFQKFSWESLIVLIGFIASLITLYLILNPDLNTYVRNSIIIDTRDTVIKADADADFRGFSIAEGSMYSYGIVQGLILAISLYSVKKGFIYVLPVVFLFVSILFNARIGFAVIIIFIFLIVVFRKVKSTYLFVIAGIIFLAYYLLFESPFFEEYQETIKWGLDFYKDAEMFIKGEENLSNYTILVEFMLFLPEKISGVIFGEGRSVFGLRIGEGSDIGYINQIFIGGLVYLILLLSFLWYFYIQLKKYSDDNLLPALFILTLLAVNIKGVAFFIPHGFFRLITFYYIYKIFMSEEPDEYLPSSPVLSINQDKQKNYL